MEKPAVPSNVPPRHRPADITKDLLEATLKSCGGNRTEAAKVLQVSPTTLLKKLRELGLDE
jgi:DNA-binding NtrC family response regulator